MRPARARLAFLSAAILAALVVVLAVILPAGAASAASGPAAETRVWAIASAAQAHVRAGVLVSPGQRLGGPASCPFCVSGSCVAPEAAPQAQEIIQSTARAQAARGVDALKGWLSGPERAAMEANPGLTSRMLGQAVHRSTADALEQAYPGRFLYRTRGPDFVDTTTGEILELITPGDVGSHLARPGYGGATPFGDTQLKVHLPALARTASKEGPAHYVLRRPCRRAAGVGERPAVPGGGR